jgi:hypothetical protein
MPNTVTGVISMALDVSDCMEQGHGPQRVILSVG